MRFCISLLFLFPLFPWNPAGLFSLHCNGRHRPKPELWPALSFSQCLIVSLLRGDTSTTRCGAERSLLPRRQPPSWPLVVSTTSHPLFYGAIQYNLFVSRAASLLLYFTLLKKRKVCFSWRTRGDGYLSPALVIPYDLRSPRPPHYHYHLRVDVFGGVHLHV